MEELHQFLKELRKRRGYSLREASDRSGLSHSYISSLELGKHPKTKTPISPSPTTLKKLSELYNYSYPELMKMAGYLDFVETPDAIQEGLENGTIIREEIAPYPVYKDGKLGAVYDRKDAARVKFLFELERRLGIDLSLPRDQKLVEKLVETFFAVEQDRNKDK